MSSYIKENLQKGLIRKSSPVCAGFFYVDKKDGSHLCINNRGLSKVTLNFLIHFHPAENKADALFHASDVAGEELAPLYIVPLECLVVAAPMDLQQLPPSKIYICPAEDFQLQAWSSLFEVLKHINPVAYKLRLPPTTDVFEIKVVLDMKMVPCQRMIAWAIAQPSAGERSSAHPFPFPSGKMTKTHKDLFFQEVIFYFRTESDYNMEIPDKNNKTLVTKFLLLGFQGSPCVRVFLFCLFLLIYCGTIFGNLLIITLVSTSRSLQTPMYFFISQLSISDILLPTDIVPNLLQMLLSNGGTISVIDCMIQLFFFCASEASECYLLTVMSYDRYVAICNPLRYTSIMTSTHCVTVIVICWFFGFSSTLFLIVTAGKLHFCGANIIDHLFCDLVPFLELACSDTFIVHLEVYLMSFTAIIIPTTIIVVSYTYIILTVLRIPSSIGRQKAFSTCSSHLIVVSIFYWSMFSVYIVPTKGQSSTMSKILSLLYTVFTPLVNPIIYSLRNKDIKKALQETLHTILI
ncbi:olfactory receptor 6N1-like [Engystomops pustulosus]|uniref:olfactory receptor 6N1-like n=1 Tax=Engystomops pustulosus TaxID=76066 RepID=UPI003AFA568A